MSGPDQSEPAAGPTGARICEGTRPVGGRRSARRWATPPTPRQEYNAASGNVSGDTTAHPSSRVYRVTARGNSGETPLVQSVTTAGSNRSVASVDTPRFRYESDDRHTPRPECNGVPGPPDTPPIQSVSSPAGAPLPEGRRCRGWSVRRQPRPVLRDPPWSREMSGNESRKTGTGPLGPQSTDHTHPSSRVKRKVARRLVLRYPRCQIPVVIGRMNGSPW